MQDEELRDFVGVKRTQQRFHALDLGNRGFDDEKNFVGGFDRTLPAVYRCETRDEIHAGGQAFFDKGACDALGFLSRTGGAEDEANVGGRRHRLQVTGCGLRKLD